MRFTSLLLRPGRQSVRTFSSSRRASVDFSHAVVGAGAVGLAIARRLQQIPSASVVLLERHRAPGTETSSRNSEVIHAGLYYGHDSLKTQLCLRGKRLLYDYCAQKRIPHRNCGKWIVAQNGEQRGALEQVENFAKEVGDGGLGTGEALIPVRWLTKEEVKRREPDVRAEEAVLESESTGILDSHAYMTSLFGDFEDAGGTAALGTRVSGFESVDEGNRGWKIRIKSNESNGEREDVEITAETLINSAGLGAIPVSNMILPPAQCISPAYAKGTYYSYSCSHPRPSTLVYPAPIPGHAGLGTHLTLDMAGRVRFGPDVEWIDNPQDLRPNPDPERLRMALDEIQSYLPGLRREDVNVDYSGIRPKLRRGASGVAGGRNFEDFYIKKEDSVQNFVNLLGIESPGLSASLAIGDYVHSVLYG